MVAPVSRDWMARLPEAIRRSHTFSHARIADSFWDTATVCASSHHSTNWTSPSMRPCPLCGAMDRKVLARRDQWDIVECARCRMVFLGSELAYAVQAKDHDWVDEYTKESSRRQEKQPLVMFL